MQSGSNNSGVVTGVHHRHVGGGASSALTTSTNTTTGATTRRASSNNKTRLLRKKSSNAGMFRKNELIVAVVITAMLTCVTVLISVKIYLSFIGGNNTTTTSNSQHYKPHINPPAEYDGDDRPQQRRGRRGGRGRPREEEYDDRQQRGGGGRRPPVDDYNDNEEDDTDILPWNEKYQIPDSIETVGDRSDGYVLLRKELDAKLPYNEHRSLAYVQEQFHGERSLYGGLIPQTQEISHSDQVPYDIYDCPETPTTNYPFQWKIPDILDNWGPDDVNPPTSRKIYHGLCVFDYNKDYEKAVTYRDLELPFVVVNDPQVAATVERWQQPDYLSNMLGHKTKHRCEYSENNHFMYYTPQGNKNKRKTKRGQRRIRENVPEGWKEPTKQMRMTYTEWLKHAQTDRTGPEDPHWYFRLIGCGGMGNDGSCDAGSSEYLFDELPFFQPKDSLYVVEPDEQKGIHCRFGMKGVIAENHFDNSRNAIVVLGGSRRYILSHPDQCEKLALYPKGHPSARHSAVDWSQPDYEEYPEFATAVANEVVLQAGQVLYLPTDWFHYIVSLELNYQCNTRSGITNDFSEHIRRCGF